MPLMGRISGRLLDLRLPRGRSAFLSGPRRADDIEILPRRLFLERLYGGDIV